MDIKPKTITYSRTRKINPGLISSQFDYGSEEVSYGSWTDVPEDVDTEQATQQLVDHVESIIQQRIEKLVFDLRSKARQKKYYYGPINAAFCELMRSQNLSDDELDIAWNKFEELLELEMSKATV